MSGQMCWLEGFATNGEKILHLRLESHEPWKPYTAFPGICVADYKVPRGSKGWATYQTLLKAGWELVSTARAKEMPELVAAKR